MGRKIPAKKHRGVKNPLVQQAKRLASLKDKINAPPKDPDEQPVPKSLTRLFAFGDPDNRKSILKKEKYPIRRQLKDNDSSTSGAAPNPISSLRKLPGESGRGFSLRINSAVKALHNPAEQLHYPLDIEVEDEKGMRMDEQREKRARKRRRAAQAAARGPGDRGVGAAAGDDSPELSRTQRLALKKQAKKMRASEALSERREVVYERVSFGDVAHAPPALHFAARPHAARPGRRDLLLTSMLAGGAGGGSSCRSGPAGGAGGSGGCRSGPAAELARRERARLEAVAAYRALKASKLKNK